MAVVTATLATPTTFTVATRVYNKGLAYDVWRMPGVQPVGVQVSS